MGLPQKHYIMAPYVQICTKMSQSDLRDLSVESLYPDQYLSAVVATVANPASSSLARNKYHTNKNQHT